jgi:hypothetical protein
VNASNDRLGSNSAIRLSRLYVRFASESGRTADISGRLKCARRQHMQRSKAVSFDHLVGPGEQRRRDFEAERHPWNSLSEKTRPIPGWLLWPPSARPRPEDFVPIRKMHAFDQVGPVELQRKVTVRPKLLFLTWDKWVFAIKHKASRRVSGFR